jgi:hypothetical protein
MSQSLTPLAPMRWETAQSQKRESELEPVCPALPYDVTRDSYVTSDDRTFWVEQLERTYFGDANLDGEFSSADLVDVLQAGKYKDDILRNTVWSEGDWDGDGEFTTVDLVVALADGGYEQGPRAAAAAVPALSTFMLLSLAILTVVSRCHRRDT